MYSILCYRAVGFEALQLQVVGGVHLCSGVAMAMIIVNENCLFLLV